MSHKFQDKPDFPVQPTKKCWTAPKINVLDLRDAHAKIGGRTDGFNRKSQ